MASSGAAVAKVHLEHVVLSAAADTHRFPGRGGGGGYRGNGGTPHTGLPGGQEGGRSAPGASPLRPSTPLPREVKERACMSAARFCSIPDTAEQNPVVTHIVSAKHMVFRRTLAPPMRVTHARGYT